MQMPSFDAALKYIRSREKPLALYLFSNDNEKVHLVHFVVQTLTKSFSQVKTVVEKSTSGGVCINDLIMHVARE